MGVANLDSGAHFELSLNQGAHTSSTNAIAVSTQTVEVGRAYHVVGTYDGAQGELTLYVDGVEAELWEPADNQQVSSSNTFSPSTLREPTDNGRIGWELEGNTGFLTRSWHGQIDEVAVYHRVLTPEEIAAHYARLHAVDPLDALDALEEALLATPLADVDAPPPARQNRINSLLNRVEEARQLFADGDCEGAIENAVSVLKKTQGHNAWLIGDSALNVAEAAADVIQALEDLCS